MRRSSMVFTLLTFFLAILVATFCGTPVASAGVSVWGGAGADFNAGPNWPVGGEPTGNTAEFYMNTPDHLTDIYLSSDIWVVDLKMNASATSPVTILSGNKLTVGAITTDAAAGLLTINANLGLRTTAQDWQVNSTAAGAGLVVGGNISGAYNQGFRKTGNGVLTLNGVGAFGAAGWAGLTLDGGKLNFGNVAALGGSAGYAGGTFTIRGNATWDNSMGSARTLTTNNNMTFYESGGGTYTFAGSNSLNMGAGAVNFTSGNTTVGTVNLVVSGSELTFGGPVDVKSIFDLKKTGVGTLTLNGVTTMGAGKGITLDAGQLNIGNAGALGAGTFTVRSGTAWDNTTGSAQTLAANNNLTFYDSGTSYYNFVGSSSLNMGTGEVNFTGGGTGAGIVNLTVGANELTFGGPVNMKTNYTLIKKGEGALTLKGALTSSSTTEFIISEGRLNIGHAGAVGSGNFVLNNNTTWDATSDLTLSMTAGRAIKLYGGGNFTFAGSHNLNMGANDVAIQAGNANVVVAANTLTFGGNVEGSSYNLLKLGGGTLVLGGGATNNGLIATKGTLVLGAAGDIKGETINGSGNTAIWVSGNGDAYDATYKVEFDGTKSVSDHDVRSQMSVPEGSGLMSMPAQVFATETPTGDISMQWRERSAPEIAQLLASNVLSLDGAAVPSKYLLTMAYDPTQLGGDEAALAASGLIDVAYKSGSNWVMAGLSYQGDHAIPTDVTGFNALAALSVGSYGVDSANDMAWVVLDHASEFSVMGVPEPGALTLAAMALVGLLAYAWRKRN